MYTDDLSFGSYAAGSDPIGDDSGSHIRIAAVDINTEALVVSENDRTEPIRPVAMLNQNFPNPFNPSTTIRFNVPREGHAKLSVFNVRGQLVKTLVDDFKQAGSNEVVWHGVDSNNRSVASGVYFYRLETNGSSEVRRMVLMK